MKIKSGIKVSSLKYRFQKGIWWWWEGN